LEYGQPLHAFDLATIGGRQIHVRLARPGEQLLCLDGETRRLTPEMLVIADAERPVALAGVIGGQETAVTDGTTDVLLEAANFDGVNVRSTSRAVRLRTEASARFEKGLSPELALAGARRAAGLLAEVAGGRVHVGWADVYPRPQEPVRVRFRPAQVDALLGVHVPLQEMEDLLRRALTGAGFTEVVTPALTSGALLDRLGVGERAMRLVNPVSDDQDVLRTSLLPSMLQVAAHNRSHERPAVEVFETARAYLRR